MSMVNCLGIDSTINIAFDSLHSLEDKVGRKICEFLHAAVSDNCGIAVPCISEKTDFDYGEMPAKAGLPVRLHARHAQGPIRVSPRPMRHQR